MAYCKKCGTFIDDDAKFCGVCGQKVDYEPTKQESQRKTVYDGNIHKCPNCGATLASFVKNCPECGYELRSSLASDTLTEFANRYSCAASIDKKISLVRTYVIPNNKEDILEFVIMASSNIDTSTYRNSNLVVSSGLSQRDLTEAWMAKFEQAYQKASLLLAGTPECKKIEELFEEKKKMLENYKDKAERKENGQKRRAALKIVLPIILGLFLMFGPLSIMSINHKINVHKLEKQVEVVEELIELGDYDTALLEAEQICLTDDWDSDETAKWENIRILLIERIEEQRGTNEGKVKIPNIDYEDKQYTEIINAFINAGFTNVTSENAHDLITGWITKEGTVIDVTINGNTDYRKGSYIEPDAVIIVRYHGF